MIADAEHAVALAAIMGGQETEVRAETTSVLLEAANFEPVGILRSSEKLALRTDGSNRWEKGVDPLPGGARRRLRDQRCWWSSTGARLAGSTDVSGSAAGPAGRSTSAPSARTR